ncbi:MAG: DoxX family protein [Candidatus Brocadiia bacterium]
MRNHTAILGRILISAIFLNSFYGKVSGFSGAKGYFANRLSEIGMNFGDSAGGMLTILLAAAAFIELAGGLSVLLGFKARMGAGSLFLFLVPTTLIFHSFWWPPAGLTPEAINGFHQMQMVNFMKNVAIMGGLLMIVANGSGGWSLDSLLCRKPDETLRG